jgi:hypothetical protein
MVLLEAGELRLLQLVLRPEVLGRSRTLVHRVFCPRRGGMLHLRPVWLTVCWP